MHLEKLEFLYPDLAVELALIKSDYDILGGKLFSFLRYVENSWNKFE